MIFLWFIMASVAILYLQNIFFERLALRRIHYDRRFMQHTCTQGEEIILIEQLTNAKWLPIPRLRVESLLDAKLQFQRLDNFAVSSGQHYQNHTSFFSLMPHTKITRKHRLTPKRRGWYKLNTVTLTGGDLLGMGNSSVQIPLNSELIVYPKSVMVPVEQLPSHSWQGEQSVHRWIISDPFVFAGTRAYQAGDTFKQINWKATAKTGQLQVHQHDYTADRRLMIYLNIDDSEEMWRTVTNEDLVERGIEWAAGAADAVIQQGMEVGFSANMPIKGELDSVHIEPQSGYEQLNALLECMAKLELERSELFSQLLERAAQSAYRERDVLIITTFWNHALEQFAERIRYNGNAVVVWHLHEEADTDGARGKHGAGVAKEVAGA